MEDVFYLFTDKNPTPFTADFVAAQKKGSSRFTGERCFYLQEEVVVIPVSICHAFQHLDLVIHSFKYARIQPVRRTSDYSAYVVLQLVSELL